MFTKTVLIQKTEKEWLKRNFPTAAWGIFQGLSTGDAFRMTVPCPRIWDSLRSGLTIQSSFSCYLHVCNSIPDAQLRIHSLYGAVSMTENPASYLFSSSGNPLLKKMTCLVHFAVWNIYSINEIQVTIAATIKFQLRAPQRPINIHWCSFSYK